MSAWRIRRRCRTCIPPWLGALRLPHQVAVQGGKTSLFDRTCAQGTAGPARAVSRFMRADARCILSRTRALTRLRARIRSARAEWACVPNADLLAEFIRRSGRRLAEMGEKLLAA